jgi:hypothetical protein
MMDSAASVWRPIETAPKGDPNEMLPTVFLAYTPKPEAALQPAWAISFCLWNPDDNTFIDEYDRPIEPTH